jgi:hypothetical protein
MQNLIHGRYRNRSLPGPSIHIAFPNESLDIIPDTWVVSESTHASFDRAKVTGFPRWAESSAHGVRNIAYQDARRIASTNSWPSCLTELPCSVMTISRSSPLAGRQFSPGLMVPVMVFDQKLDLKGLRIDDRDEVLGHEVLVACHLRHLPHNHLWKVLGLLLEWNVMPCEQGAQLARSQVGRAASGANSRRLGALRHGRSRSISSGWRRTCPEGLTISQST